MPWTTEDVEQHKTGLSAAQKRQWVVTANSALAECLADGGEESACEGRAIRIANAAVQEALAAEEERETELEDGVAFLGGEIVPLVERAVRDDGTIPIKIIAPGWGASGYYSPEVLARDGPLVFRAGLHTYWDHPSATEARERPERSLRDLAGALTTDAYYDAHGPAGPGLYGEARVTEQYRKAVSELAQHIGVSIRAYGRAREGEAEGRKGPVIGELTSARSVDYVTTPGAGGRILELFEAAGREPAQEATVTEQEAQELREQNESLKLEVARLREGLLLRQAQEAASEALAAVELPEPTRRRLVTAQAAKPVVAEDGALDEAAYRAQVQEAARVEMAYLSELRGSGRIVGMGRADQRDDTAQLIEAFKRTGLSQEQAVIAAKGR